MVLSKRKQHSLKNGYQNGHKGRKEPTTTITKTDDSPKETENELILPQRLREKPEKPVPAKADNSNNIMLMQFENYRDTLAELACPKCFNIGSLMHTPTSINGLSTYYKIMCSNCNYSSKLKTSCSSEKLDLLALAIRTLGIRNVQAEQLLQILGLEVSYVPVSNPTETKNQSVNLGTEKFQNITNNQAKVIVEQIAPKVVEEAKDELYEHAKIGNKAKIGADTAYSNTGRNAQGSVTSLIAELPNSYKIVDYQVTKRAQETDRDKHVKGNVLWDTSAQLLEKENMKLLIDRFIVEFANIYPIMVSTDKDAAMPKMVKELTKQCFNEVITLTDAAHLCKNIRARLLMILGKKGIEHKGDGYGKIGNQCFYRLSTTCKLKVKLLCKLRREKGISRDEIRQELKILKMHCLGFHIKCKDKGKHCGKERLLKVYKQKGKGKKQKFDHAQLQLLLDEMFDKYLCSESMVHDIYFNGTTSQCEFFHSILTNHRLVVKNDNIRVASYFYDASIAVGVSFFNLGEKAAFLRIFGAFGFRLNKSILKTLETREKAMVKRREHNLTTKPIILAARTKNQKQNRDETEYRKSLSEQKRKLEEENDEFQYRSVAERFAYEQTIQNINVRKRKAEK